MIYKDLTNSVSEEEVIRSKKYIDILSLQDAIELLPKIVAMKNLVYRLSVRIYKDDTILIRYMVENTKANQKGDSISILLFKENVSYSVVVMLENLLKMNAVEVTSELKLIGNKKIVDVYLFLINKSGDTENSIVRFN